MENLNKNPQVNVGKSYPGLYVSGNVNSSPEAKNVHDIAYKSYDERYNYAKERGLSDANAKEYASATYSTVEDSFWSRAGQFFGGKLSSTKYNEAMQEKDAGLLRELLEKQNIQDYEDPQAQTARREAAGLNDSLNGGQQIGSGNPGEIDDTTLGADGAVANAVNSEAAAQPIKVAESLMNCLGGVMNLANAGVGVASSILNMDISEGQAAFDMIGKIKDLGDFFPFLGIQYTPEEKSWAEIEDAEHTLSLEQVRGMSKDEFFDRVSQRTGIKSLRYLREMYNAYRAMASPANINAYMNARKENMNIQNDTVDAAVGGVKRFGTLTSPTPNFSLPWHNVDGNYKYTFDRAADQDAFNYYVDKTTELALYGLEADIAGNKTKVTTEEASNIVAKTCKDLIIRLHRDATLHNSMLAKYLLVNMLSGTFNGIGEAAYLTHQPNIKTIGEAWNFIQDASVMSFLGAKQFVPGLLNTELGRHRMTSSASRNYTELHSYPHAPRK